jgi:hypothetical protein
VGHANLSNLSDFFVRRLFAKGKLSVKECSDAMVKAGVTFNASEGRCSEPYMLRLGLEDIISFMLDPEAMGYRFRKGQPETAIIEPVGLTERQKELLSEWKRGDASNWDSGDDGDGGEYGEFDAIVWKFAPGWRKLYPDIPKLGNVTH